MSEVSNLLGVLGLAPRCKEEQRRLKGMLSEVDADGSGSLDMPEFESLVLRVQDMLRADQRHRARKVVEEFELSDCEVVQLRDLFHALDEEGREVLGIASARRLAERLRKSISGDALRELMAELSCDNA